MVDVRSEFELFLFRNDCAGNNFKSFMARRLIASHIAYHGPG